MKNYIYFPLTTQSVKTLAHKTNKGFRIPDLEFYRKQVQSLGIELPSALRPTVFMRPEHPSWSKLYKHQQDTIDQLLVSDKPGALLNLWPGLGKTATSIVAAEILEFKRVLVICSKTIFQAKVWQKEIDKWSKHPLYQEWGSKKEVLFLQSDLGIPVWWHITTYETFCGMHDYTKQLDKVKNEEVRVRGSLNRPVLFDKVEWDLIIWDESLHLKSRRSTRVEALNRTKKEHIWLLSGNPTRRYNDDLWPQMHAIWPEAFPSYWTWAYEYCRIEQNAWARVIKGNRTNNPADDYSDLIITKTQEQELPDLPDFIFRQVDVQLLPAQQLAHDRVLDEMIMQLESGEQELANKAVANIKALQIISSMGNILDAGDQSAKHDAISELFGSRDIQFPCIIWCHWVKGAVQLFERIRKENPELRVGLVSSKNKKPIQEYIDGHLDVLFLGLEIGKHGITLTNTRHMVYLDRNYDPDSWLQSLRRVKRIGLTHHPVVTVVRAPGTVEDLVEDNLAGKIPGIAALAHADLAKMLRGIRFKKGT